MKLAYTRAMVRAALSGALDRARYHRDPVFGLEIPAAVPDVPPTLLDPRKTWNDAAAYDVQARKLAGMFRENFVQYAGEVSGDAAEAGPVA
jgi:phosphoenolpyruvate carboxykinase (ATP)